LRTMILPKFRLVTILSLLLISENGTDEV